MEEHNCSQQGVLATICEKLSNIENDVGDIKKFQSTFGNEMKQMAVDNAKYPPPDIVMKQFAKIDRHDLYFKILYFIMLCAWGVILLIVGKLL